VYTFSSFEVRSSF